MSHYDSIKEEIVTCTRWLSEHGYFGGLINTGGNVSVRIPDKEAIAITPSGVRYQEMTKEDVPVIAFNLAPLEGTLKPSIESAMHIAVYKNRPEIGAVVHTHQEYASIFALLNQPIPALFDEVTLDIGEIVDIVSYGLSGSPELVENVTKKLDNGCHCYVMQNHGALSLGTNLKKAWKNAELLEKLAKAYYHALSTGFKVSVLPDATVNLLKEIRKSTI
jgi:L-ribulose-5-phosphate 4-epimerase